MNQGKTLQKALMVTADVAFLTACKEQLVPQDYSVRHVQTRGEAECCSEAMQFDLLLVDAEACSGLDGALDLCAKIKARTPSTLVALVLSDNTMPSSPQRMVDAIDIRISKGVGFERGFALLTQLETRPLPADIGHS